MEDLYNYLLKTPTINPNVAVSLAIADASDDTADATATASDIKEGKTAYIASGKVTGTFKGVDTSDATAASGDILADKTAYAKGEKITGSLSEKATYSIASDIVKTEVTFGGYKSLELDGVTSERVLLQNGSTLKTYATYQAVRDAIGLTADKIKVGETILGITGTYAGSPAE
jgi:hypothetical protein